MRTMVAALVAVTITGMVGSALVAPATATVERKGSKVSLKSIPQDSMVGKKVALKGKAAGARSVVKIQRKYAGSGWQTVEKTRSSKKKKYSTTVKLTRGGTTKFRAKDGRKKSQVRSLDVYQWLDAMSEPHVFVGQGLLNQTVHIGGRSFPRSSLLYESLGQLAVHTAGLCTKAEVYTGFLDEDLGRTTPGDLQRLQWGPYDPSDGPGSADLVSVETPIGPAVRQRLGVANSRYLLMGSTVEQADDSAGPAAGVLATPRVLCNAASLPGIDIDELTEARGRALLR